MSLSIDESPAVPHTAGQSAGGRDDFRAPLFTDEGPDTGFGALQ